MGAIAGIIGFGEGKNIVGKMLSVQRHRGGDKKLLFENDHMTIGMCNAHIKYPINPLASENVVAVIDGIMLNIDLHLKDLHDRGIDLSDRTPVTVLSELYKLHGEDLFNLLQGEFSAALWDDEKKQIVIMRDRFGHKPIFYKVAKDQLIFSSEIKGILEANIKREVDEIAISDFLSLGLFPSPRTPFSGIYKLPPGSLLIYRIGDNVRIKKWFDDSLAINPSLKLDVSIKQFKDLLTQAILQRAPANKAYSFLSGGIDTSTIIGLLTENEREIHTFTMGFDDSEESEISDALLISKYFGTHHKETILKPEKFIGSIPKILFHYDEPYRDTSSFPTYHCAGFARESTDRILTGDSPDQLYAGSPCYDLLYEESNPSKNSLTSVLLKPIVKLFLSFDLAPAPTLIGKAYRILFYVSRTKLERAVDFAMRLPFKKYICTNDFIKIHYDYPPLRSNVKSTGNIVKDVISWQMAYTVPDDLMVKVDRCCMAHGLETLSPFQDGNLFQLVRDFPVEFLLQREGKNTVGKYFLRKIAAELLPKEILEKPKHGFSIPIAKWMRKYGKEILMDVVLSDQAMQRGYFRKRNLTRVVESFIREEPTWFFGFETTLFSLITLELWHQQYIDRR